VGNVPAVSVTIDERLCLHDKGRVPGGTTVDEKPEQPSRQDASTSSGGRGLAGRLRGGVPDLNKEKLR
jgi:hypothetical protein